MRILIVNPILYTSETSDIPVVSSVEDTMIISLCRAFSASGHEVVLAACDRYRPTKEETYPFEIRWFPPFCPGICKPHVFPVLKGLSAYWKQYGKGFDLIISGEVFSLNTLFFARHAADRLIIWQELAKHNRMGKTIPSHIWYRAIAGLLMRRCLVVGRSVEARDFISAYLPRVAEEVIDHGVDLARFSPVKRKEDYFFISSQLIPRKRIDLSIERFVRYRQKYDARARLLIAGKGESAEELKKQAGRLVDEGAIVFLGQLKHEELIPLLASARALLVSTEKDNNMISIVESIAVGTPVITSDVPYNAGYIRAQRLGVSGNWGEEAIQEVVSHESEYVDRCLAYRTTLSTEYRVKQFLDIAREYLPGFAQSGKMG